MSLSERIDGRTVWTCTSCGRRDYWAEGWLWFGTLDLVERVECPSCAPIGVELLDARRGIR